MDLIDRDLVEDWYSRLQDRIASVEEFREPILCKSSVGFLQNACESMHQNEQIFFLALETLERYVARKNATNSSIKSRFGAICAAIYLSNKSSGLQPALTLDRVQNFIDKNARKSIDIDTVLRYEIDIFMSLGGSIPLATRIDDLNVMLEVYVRGKIDLHVNIRKICIDLLLVLALNQRRIFKELYSIYSQNGEAYKAFASFYCNRMYYPSVVIFTALRLCKLKLYVNMFDLLENLSKEVRIHHDHVYILSQILVGLVDEH